MGAAWVRALRDSASVTTVSCFSFSSCASDRGGREPAEAAGHAFAFSEKRRAAGKTQHAPLYSASVP
jgi:hypothetical protein